MSLINDALRRAKQAHQAANTPPLTPDSHFRPVEPTTQAVRHGIGVLLPALLAAMALLGLLLFWELSHKDVASTSADRNAPMAVAARALPSQDVPASASDSPAEVTATGNKSAASPRTESAPEPTSAALGPASTNAISTTSDPGDTNHPAVTEPTVPTLKLQGIIYNPRRPSALINGRVMFLGDRIREYRILAIRRDEVVLAGAGQTNVLSLDP